MFLNSVCFCFFFKCRFVKVLQFWRSIGTIPQLTLNLPVGPHRNPLEAAASAAAASGPIKPTNCGPLTSSSSSLSFSFFCRFSILLTSEMVKALPLHLGTVKSFPKFDAPFDLPVPRLVVSGHNGLPLSRKFPPLSQKVSATGEKISVLGAWTQESPLQFRDESPVSIELKSICSELEFDKAIADAGERNELVILVWYVCVSCGLFWEMLS